MAPATSEKKAPRPTREQLESEIAKLCGELASSRTEARSHLNALHEAHGREKELRNQLDGLKERLARAEADNQRMRGYIDRVQEDDVAREDLVTVGDPAGEQQLVPKRRPKHFSEPNAYDQLGTAMGCDSASTYLRNHERPKPRHWVTY